MNQNILIFYKTTPEIEKQAKIMAKEINADILPDRNSPDINNKKYDLIIPIGGDGTVLHAETAFPKVKKLPLGAGRVEFLASASLKDWKKVWQLYLQNKYFIEKRMKISYSQHEALNEINITKKNLGQMFEGEIYLNNELLHAIRGDGIIVATPTGSTAYSLSAGGSIIDPQIAALIITPVTPFASFYRPLIIPPETKIKIVSKTSCNLVIDGIVISDHKDETEFKIEKSNVFAQIIRFSEKVDLYQKLHLLK